MTIGIDRMTYFGAVVLLLGGYLMVYRPAESAVAERYAQLDDTRVRLDERLAHERHAGALRDEAGALANWIRRAGLHATPAAIVNRFLIELATIAGADGVRVTAVTAEPAPALGPPASHAAAIVFEELPLNVSLRGSYTQMLRVVRDLDRGDVAARIGIDAFTNDDRSAAHSPALGAMLHVTLLRIPADTTMARDADG